MKPILLGYDVCGQPVFMPPERQSHMHVVGSSGSGKSKFLEHLMRQMVRRRRAFALLDPHGTLYDAMVEYCAHHALDRDIILVDPSSGERSVAFNPFRRPP
jgi:type IV secretory pathway VirB4 component